MPKRKKNVIVGNATIVCPHCGFDNGAIGYEHPVLGATYVLPCGKCRKAITCTLRVIYEVGAVSVTLSATDSVPTKTRKTRPKATEPKTTVPFDGAKFEVAGMTRDEILQKELDDAAHARKLKREANLPPEL